MVLKFLFHLFGAAQFFLGCYYDYNYVSIPNSSMTQFGGKFKYLTFLNAMIQTLYFTVATLNDVTGNNEISPSQTPLLRRVKDILFTSLAFPISMFVGITFWGIYAIDRELILPRSMDPYFPVWLNHVMHSNIVLFVLIDLVTSFRMYPKKNVGLKILSVFMLGYAVWIHVIYFQTGIWVYPILKVLNWPVRFFFYLLSLGFVIALYTVGETLNKIVWSGEVEETVRSGKKKAK